MPKVGEVNESVSAINHPKCHIIHSDMGTKYARIVQHGYSYQCHRKKSRFLNNDIVLIYYTVKSENVQKDVSDP